MPLVDTAWTGIRLEYDPKNNPNFEIIVKEALTMIASKPVGASLLDCIGKQAPKFISGTPPGCNVLITPTLSSKFIHKSVRDVPTDVRQFQPVGLTGSCNAAMSPVDGENTATGSVCKLMFNNTIVMTSRGETTWGFIVLAHELIHSLHNLMGNKKDGDAEELWTTGIGEYEKADITENKIRAEHNLPLRQSYFD